MKKMDWKTVHLQYKGGVNWRVKKQSHIYISKAPGALIRKKYGYYETMMKTGDGRGKWWLNRDLRDGNHNIMDLLSSSGMQCEYMYCECACISGLKMYAGVEFIELPLIPLPFDVLPRVPSRFSLIFFDFFDFFDFLDFLP